MAEILNFPTPEEYIISMLPKYAMAPMFYLHKQVVDILPYKWAGWAEWMGTLGSLPDLTRSKCLLHCPDPMQSEV